MSGSEQVRGIVFTHGDMAVGMVDAVGRIAGVAAEGLVPLSNAGLGPDALRQELERIAGDGPVLIFTDLHAGSCTLAAQVSSRGQGGRAVICGVNLPMLLDFVFQRHLPLEELVPRLVEKGRTTIRGLTFPAPGAAPRPGG